MELASNACEKHLVLLAGTGPAGRGLILLALGVRELIAFLEEGSNRRGELTARGRQKPSVWTHISSWVSSVVAGMGGLGYMLAGAGHKQEFTPAPRASIWALCPDLMLQRHLEASVCPVSRNSTPCVGELCGTPGLRLCLPTWCTLLPGLLVMMLVWAETRCYEQQQRQMFHSCLLLLVQWPLSLNQNFCKDSYLFFFF